MDDYRYSSITEVSELVRQQKVSPVELVAGCLERIEQLNPKLNAFITVMADQALKDARIAEEEIKSGKWKGPLHGIPIGIKDFYDTAGVKTTAAFKYFKNRVPAKDAIAVAKLKEAGAIIIGKMNMHELGMGTTGLISFYGLINNPWNSKYIPGGSSGGSAAAVASGMCYATLDTDAIGSCRLPAACCGVVGFKGTYDLISLKGILDGEQPPDEMIRWLSHAGITARNVSDAALMLDVLAEKNGHTESVSFVDELSKDRKLRIGVANNFRADQDVASAFEKAVAIFQSLGYSMTNVAASFGDPNGGIANIEADRKSIDDQAFKDVDVLLLPTTPTTVPTIKDTGGNAQALSPENTAFANYYGLPAISIPCGFDANGLPLGLQIVGKPRGEGDVLDMAHKFQQATQWHLKHPMVD